MRPFVTSRRMNIAAMILAGTIAVSVSAQDMDPAAIRRQFEQSRTESQAFLDTHCNGGRSNDEVCENVRESLRMAERFTFSADGGDEPQSRSYVAGRSAGPAGSAVAAKAESGDPACLDPEPRLATGECDQLDAACGAVRYRPYRGGDRMRLTVARNGMATGFYMCDAGRGWRRLGA